MKEAGLSEILDQIRCSMHSTSPSNVRCILRQSSSVFCFVLFLPSVLSD